RLAAVLGTLAGPERIARLRRQAGFPGVELLALLVDCQMLFKTGAVGDAGLRADEGDDSLLVWDFHDLLFHARSTEGRHANPTGGTYPHARTVAEPPAAGPRGPRAERRSARAAFCRRGPAARAAPARPPFGARFRRPPSDHAHRAGVFPRPHRAYPVDHDGPVRGGGPAARLHRAAVSVGR